MDRNHVHFAVDYPGGSVISGARTDSDVFIEIDTELAMQDGLVFFRSQNNVILTRGKNGLVSPKYFKKVTVNG